jgi:hypothetical protein
LIFFIFCFEGTFGCKIQKEVNSRQLVDLTFDQCFVQNLSSRGRNEVILVELERYLSIHIWQENFFKKKDHGNRSLQSQISHFANVDLWSFRLEYLELEKSI